MLAEERAARRVAAIDGARIVVEAVARGAGAATGLTHIVRRTGILVVAAPALVDVERLAAGEEVTEADAALVAAAAVERGSATEAEVAAAVVRRARIPVVARIRVGGASVAEAELTEVVVGTRIAVVARVVVRQEEAPRSRVAEIIGAGIEVVAGGIAPRNTRAPRALVADRARVAVVTLTGIVDH